MPFTPKNRNDWRTWLRRCHASEAEVWVVFFKKTAPKSNLSYNDAVEEAVCFGWIDGVKREDTRQRRIKEALDLLAHGKKLGMR